jgi:hypothetical protein
MSLMRFGEFSFAAPVALSVLFNAGRAAVPLIVALQQNQLSVPLSNAQPAQASAQVDK